MLRVSDDEVKAVIQTNNTTIPFIDTANLIVTENLVGLGHSDGRLKQIELYLAAHFVAITEERGGLVRSATGDDAETYSDPKGKGFESTRYGQQAMALDTTGTLAKFGKNKLTATFEVV